MTPTRFSPGWGQQAAQRATHAGLLAAQQRLLDAPLCLLGVPNLDDDAVERTTGEVDDHDVAAIPDVPELTAFADPGAGAASPGPPGGCAVAVEEPA